MRDELDEGARWVTLREAQDASGASIPALRRWYRDGLVASLLVPGAHGDQRLVDLDQVTARAASSPTIGRRRSRRSQRDADVTDALISQVAAMAMEIADLRERVELLEAER